jgi:two-component system osmolarity sensor histidine kinase EnvZ
MATSDIEARRPESSGLLARVLRTAGAVSNSWNRFWRLVGIYMPKRLYARSLLIIITPMILLQSVVTLVFMERHWQQVTQRLSTATTRDLAAVVDMIETYPNDPDYANVIRIAQDRLSMKIDILPPDPLPPPGR